MPMMNHTTNQHFHIHYGDPDELGEDDSAALDLPVTPNLSAVLTEVAKYLLDYKKMLVAENPTDLTLYRTVRDNIDMLRGMDDEQTDIISAVGIELEIAEGESVSIIPCNYGACTRA